VQLHPALVLARPQIRKRPAQLGVPHQRRQVVDHDGHADVVDGAVGGDLDRAVSGLAAPEEPDVARAGQLERLVEWHLCSSPGCRHGA
jgi:hypothetical protein